jgi:diguanylate cyclase
MAIRARRQISECTYLELVRSLFSTLVPSTIMAVLYIVTASLCTRHTPGSLTYALAVLGSGMAIVRVVVIVVLRAHVAKRGLDMQRARITEWIFGTVYLSFAVIVGSFAAACVSGCPIADQMVISALVVGYAAGVAAHVSLRPWIGVPAVLVSVAPTIVVSLGAGDPPHLLLAFVLSGLMAGGIASMLGRYQAKLDTIEMQQRFASLARTDPLTGLANRLALEDGFLQAVAVCGGRDVVLHCFDLDRFKPVNDQYGHVIGDFLLQVVAQRLTRLLRSGDLAVRLGGDEFAVMQTHVDHPDQAELMARRIARSLAEPYALADHEVRIGASVGSASGMDHGPDLARLLSAADKALYEVKNGRSEPHALAG